jgi:hypothetical protein
MQPEAVVPTSGLRARSIIGPSRSATADSPRPKVGTVRTRTVFDGSSSKAGTTSFSNMGNISRGGPGRQ